MITKSYHSPLITGVFIMHIGFFEPIVIFFRITNLPATFQVMINKILNVSEPTSKLE